MKKILLLGLVLWAVAAIALAQNQTTTLSIDCWSGGHCAMPCGGSGQGNYDCSDGTGGWTPSCAFADPLPSGAKVVLVRATIFSHQCAASTSLTATLNGQPIQSVTESRSSCSCLNSPCLDTQVQSTSYPNGFPGYVYGGSNTFGIDVTGGTLCVEHTEVTLEYTRNQLEIVRPTADQDFDLSQETYSATQTVTYEARLNPPDAARNVDWDVLLEYQTSGGRGAFQDRQTFQTQAGRTHDETYRRTGGRLTINASAVINSQTVNATPVRATVTGVAIPDADITARLVNLYRNGATPRLMTGISSVESTYSQFRTLTLYGRQDRWPNESFDGGSHVGLMQMPTNQENAWSWEDNTNNGVNLFQEKLRIGRSLMRRIIQAHRGLRQLTDVEQENMALVLYGPHASADLGRQYYAPVATPAGGWDWTVNTAGNAAGVGYADNCRGSQR